MKYFVLIIALNLLAVPLKSQDLSIQKIMNRSDLKLSQIDSLANKQFEITGKGRGSGYNQFQRWLYEKKYHLDDQGYIIPTQVEWAAYQQGSTNLFSPSSGSCLNNFKNYWTEIGPFAKHLTSSWTPGIGRLFTFAIDQNDENTIYVGSPAGGIWKTINGGSSWNCLLQYYGPWIKIYSLAIDPLNSNILYAGTGGGSSNILKSIDGGMHWDSLQVSSDGDIRKILILPTTPSIILACDTSGILRSSNAGQSWNRVCANHKEDIEYKPNNMAIMYSCGDTDVQRSTDTGKTWAPIMGIDNSGRKQLAVSAANSDIVYLIRSTSDKLRFGTLYKSEDSGNSFFITVVGNHIINTAYFGYSNTGGLYNSADAGQAFHDMAICVSQLDEDEVYIGGVNCWKSINGGTGFYCKTYWDHQNLMGLGYNHADIHGLQFFNNHLYSISDGGLYRSNDTGHTWIDLSAGLGIRQFYKIAGSSLNANVFTGGTYDNGSTCNTDSLRDWLGADGGEGLCSSSNAQHLWGSSQNGKLYRTINGGLTKIDLGTIPNANWIAPFVLHPTDDQIVFGGGEGIYLSTNYGANFTKISGSTITGKVSDIAIAHSNPNYIYACNNSLLYSSYNFGVSWDPHTINATITDICVSKYNPEKIWVTTMNPRGVYVSNNHGVSFQNITDQLPNIAAKSIVVDEDHDTTLYLAMNWGIFTRSHSQSSWIEITENLPRVEIMELDFQTNFHKLRVATFGRGIWEADAGVIPSVQISVLSGNLKGCIGENIIFQASATNQGINPQYQWKVNGVNAGSNSPTLVLNNIQNDIQVSCTLHSPLSFALPNIIESNQILTNLNQNPTVQINNPQAICSGDSLQLFPSISVKTSRALASSVEGGTISNQGFAFTIDNLQNTPIDITGIQAYIDCATFAEIWYKIGNLNTSPFVGNFGWTQIGNTVSVLPLGKKQLTDIPFNTSINLLPNTSYSIMIICDGMMYGDTMNPLINMFDPFLNVEAGISGNGFGGIFNFNGPLKRWNGRIVYQVPGLINTHTWSPNYQINTSSSINPFVSPDSSFWYSISITDTNGCESSSPVYVPVNPTPLSAGSISGSVNFTPASICLGENALLQFEPINCANSNGFYYAQQNGNWNIVNSSISAYFGTMFINSDSMVLSGGVGQLGIVLSCSGILSFDWRIQAGMGSIAPLDIPMYAINFNPIPFNNFNPNVSDLQSGTINLSVNAGDTFSFFIYPSLNYPYGFIDFSIRNFKVPIPGNNVYYPIWYDVPEGGIPLTYLYGLPDSATFKPTISGSKKYYCQIINSQTACASSERIPTNTIDINALPNVSVIANPNIICEGDTSQLSVTASSIEVDSLSTQKINDMLVQGNAFDIHAIKPITIKKLKMLVSNSVTEIEVWYKAGGYGNTNLFSNTSWTKLGNTIVVSSAGVNAFTEIPISIPLNIPAGETYGIVIVSNGNSFTGNGTTIGDILVSNPDIIVKQGHGGNGFGSNFNFTISPTKWNGEIVYEVNNQIINYTWTPSSFLTNMNTANTKASPAYSTVYNVSVEDSNTCKQEKNIQVIVNAQAIAGDIIATPDTICFGDSLHLQYNYSNSLVCNGGLQNGFAGIYAPANWTLVQNNANGSVISNSAPFSIHLLSSDGLIGSGYTNYSTNIFCNGILSFNWSYINIDYPNRDYPMYSLDGINFYLLPGFDTSNFTLINTGSALQQGIFQANVVAGQTFTIQLFTVDNIGNGFDLFLYNFSAPKQNFVPQYIQWYDSSVGGNLIGNANPLNLIPNDTGIVQYFVQITNAANGCINKVRIPSDTIYNAQLPALNIAVSATSICYGDTITITASGADAYYWEPGSYTGSTILVNPLTSTTYTIVASNANGCSKTSTIHIQVNPIPLVIATASDQQICIGDSTQLFASGAQSYIWQPGNIVNISPVIFPIISNTYTVIGTDINGCKSESTIEIIVDTLPNTTIYTNNPTICINESTILIGTGGQTFSWLPGGANSNSIIVSPILNTTYTLITTDSNTGCTNSNTITVNVNPIPSFAINPSPAIICNGQSITLSAVGSYTYQWQPGMFNGNSINVMPNNNTIYTVTATNGFGCSATSTHEVIVNNCNASSTLHLTCYIEGYYDTNGHMQPVLFNQGVSGAALTICDSVTIELRNAMPPFEIINSQKTILNTNGNITCNFPDSGNYYIAIRHRNAICTWTAYPITLSNSIMFYNFSDMASKAYGANQVQVDSGVYAFYSGEINQDENIDLLDASLVDIDINNFIFGYSSSDINGDGNVDLLDAPIVETNIINFIFSNHP